MKAAAIEVETCSVVEEEDVVADVKLVVAKNHSTCRITTLHLLHELDLRKQTHRFHQAFVKTTKYVTDLEYLTKLDDYFWVTFDHF